MAEDEHRTVTVRATSADKAVRGSMSQNGDVTIDLDAARVTGLSPAAVGSAATDVLRGLIKGFRKPGQASGPDPEPASESPADRALAAYYRQLADLELEVIGPRGLVKAAWRDEQPHVRVRPDAKPPAWVLTAELNAAIEELFTAYTRHGREIFQRHVSLRRLAGET